MTEAIRPYAPPVAGPGAPAIYPLTDCGNAERLVDQQGDCIRFCAQRRQWFVWNGARWAADEGSAVQLVKKTVRAIRVERAHIMAQAEFDNTDWDAARRQADALARWASRSEGAHQISAALRLAQSDPRVRVEPDEFDRDTYILNVRNGSVDLRSGVFREHRADELLTKLAGPEYGPKARCRRWKKFLAEVFKSHTDVIPYLQKAIGYTLTGETCEECIFVLVGRGRNGKSTLLAIVQEILGEYSGVAEVDTFLASGATKLREDIADMRGRRFVSAQEPFVNSRFAEATLKWVSGGDRLRARRLYEHAQEFQPTHKLWLAMNRVAALRSDDDASWSRLRVIPFDVSFEAKGDRDLKAELRGETPGILNWAIEGCLLWQRTGLGSCPSVDAATQHWRGRMNGRTQQS